MSSLFIRNLFFTILQPGMVAGFIPYLMLDKPLKSSFEVPLTVLHYLGIVLFLFGLVVLIHCIANFAIRGKGTLSPADPTKKLVVKGLYKYSRNPMYMGVSMMLVAECLFFNYLYLYTALIVVAFFLFVKYFEEPRLRNEFGMDYEAYCQSVNRWL